MCKRASPRTARACVRQSAAVGILIANESAPIIEHNLVFNASTGIGVEGASEPMLSYNIIANEDKETLFGTGLVTNASSAKMEDNIVVHYDLIVSNNYWGNTSLEEIGRRIIGERLHSEKLQKIF